MKARLIALIPTRFRTAVRALYRRAYYWGPKYRCPICRARLRRFFPFGFKPAVLQTYQVVGAGYRENARCPHCHSIDRDRLLYLFLLRKTEIFENQTKLLHVAPEPQISSILRAQPNVDYVSGDLYSPDAMIRMDVTKIPFPDNHFDAIICNHVLEHVTADRAAMTELHRTLRLGGWAILQAPISSTLARTYEDSSIDTATAREAAFGQEDHVRIYAADYKDRLERVGFKVVVFKWTNEAQHFGGMSNRFGLNIKEPVYFVMK